MIYLDHNATTPAAPEVREAMAPWLAEEFGNPSSLHRPGRQARDAVERARAIVAALLNAKPEEVIFTSGGSESNNMVLQSVLGRSDGKRHIITSRVEHPSVLGTCRWLERQGCRVTYVPVDRYGQVDPAAVEAAISDDTALVSIMHANNEVGTLQPIAAIGAICRARGLRFHTDAVQSVGVLPLDVRAMGIDVLSIAGHKLYGPKGIGALYARHDVPLRPLIHGGHQEEGRRAGTESVAAIVGLGCAAALARGERTERATHIASLRDRFWEGLRARIEGMHRHGHPSDALPGTLALGMEGIEGESLVMALDQEGICASTGSACSSGRMTPSHVLLAMSVPTAVLSGAVRFSLGSGNTSAELDRVIEILPVLVKRLRAMNATSAALPRS